MDEVNMLISQRDCFSISDSKIEDEYHFVMECGLYNEQRLHFLSDMNKMLPGVLGSAI